MWYLNRGYTIRAGQLLVPLTRRKEHGTVRARPKGVSAMAKCPVCEHEVATPFFLNVDGWRWLVCPHCSARLERKNPRYAFALSSFFLSLLALGRLGHRFAVIAELLMVAIIVVMLVEFTRPQLQLRKPPPKPEIKLDINGSPKQLE
jgi:hypothetical protein